MLVVQDNREGERERGSTYLSGYTFYSLLFSATNQNTYKIDLACGKSCKNNMYVYTNFITAYVDNC